MSKKNKDIKVRIEETNRTIKGTEYVINQLSIGKKLVGEVMTLGSKGTRSFFRGRRPRFIQVGGLSYRSDFIATQSS